MKITRKQLRQIIKEEQKAIVPDVLVKQPESKDESFDDWVKKQEPKVAKDLMVIDKDLANKGFDEQERREELKNTLLAAGLMGAYGAGAGAVAGFGARIGGGYTTQQRYDIAKKHGFKDSPAYRAELEKGTSWAGKNPVAATAVGAGIGALTGALTSTIVQKLQKKKRKNESLTRKQLKQIIKEELSVMEEATRSKPWAWQLPGSSIPGRQPDYGEGNLTIADVQELFPSLSPGEQDDIWEKYKHLNNAGELKAAILEL